ncbi:MAG TPA: ribosome maturation factor RimM [Syntrophorhabdaceae bacterium]|nr:ribosome maturation factor RimM [Syntrophorhabdaceae bacterium]HNT67737.1 ribosome maturation factor RimM [Syntrophorhabdaceae bacterium]
MRWIPVGRVLSVHGIRGEVKFHYYNEAKEEFLRYASLYAEKDDSIIEIKPASIRFHKNLFLIRFKGLGSPEEASFLVKKELLVREGDLPQLDRGEYYDYQLIGLRVLSSAGEEIGKVDSMLHTQANDILVVSGKQDIMVPMIEGHIIEIDLERSFIKIQEGLVVP